MIIVIIAYDNNIHKHNKLLVMMIAYITKAYIMYHITSNDNSDTSNVVLLSYCYMSS